VHRSALPAQTACLHSRQHRHTPLAAPDWAGGQEPLPECTPEPL
jgi:hypothetical protein